MDPSLSASLQKEIEDASSFAGEIPFVMKDNSNRINVLHFCSKSFYSQHEGIDPPSPNQIFDPTMYPPTKEGFLLLKQSLILSACLEGQRIKLHRS